MHVGTRIRVRVYVCSERFSKGRERGEFALESPGYGASAPRNEKLRGFTEAPAFYFRLACISTSGRGRNAVFVERAADIRFLRTGGAGTLFNAFEEGKRPIYARRHKDAPRYLFRVLENRRAMGLVNLVASVQIAGEKTKRLESGAIFGERHDADRERGGFI